MLARTHEQLAVLRPALEAAGVAVQRRAIAAGQPAALPWSSAHGVPSPSQLRSWAHDILEPPRRRSPSTMPPHEQAERRVAAAALDYLREQPDGDGNGFRTWVTTSAVFAEAGEATSASSC